MQRGTPLLHHVMYDEAQFVFSIADDRDPAYGFLLLRRGRLVRFYNDRPFTLPTSLFASIS